MSLNPQNNPSVSILLPTHNRADVLYFAICSILAQTYQDFELLVVGDGCTDNTAEVVQSFNDPRIRWFDLPKAPGFGYANRNIALRLARGGYIAYLAHDDLWLPDHLENLIPIFEDEKIEIVFSRPLLVIPRGMIVPGIFNLNHAATLSLFLNTRCEINSGCVVHRTSCFFKYGYWNEDMFYGSDWDMWKRILKNGREGNFAYTGNSFCLHFKANWHNESQDKNYHVHWRFRFWMRLFAADQMPACLKVDVADDITEQEAVWTAISSEPQGWGKKIRLAIQQVFDLCALQGNSLAEELLTVNEEFKDEILPLNSFFGFDFSRFIESFKQMPVNQNILNDTQASLMDIQNELKDAQGRLMDVQKELKSTQDKLMDTQNEIKDVEDQLMAAKIEIKDTQVTLGDVRNELMNIKRTLTWRMHDYIANIGFVLKIYMMIMSPLRRWYSTRTQK